MKLIFCDVCEDMVKLNYHKRYCKCRESWGKYTKDGIHAIIGGSAIPIGIANYSFVMALDKRHTEEYYGPRFEAWVIPDSSDHVEVEKKNEI